MGISYRYCILWHKSFCSSVTLTHINVTIPYKHPRNIPMPLPCPSLFHKGAYPKCRPLHFSSLDYKLGYIFKTYSLFFWFAKIAFILALSSNFLKAFVICRISKHVLFHHPNYLWKCSSHPRQIIMENILSIWQWTTDTALWGQSVFCALGHVSFFFFFYDCICEESFAEGKICIIAPFFFSKKGSTRWSGMVMQILSCPTIWSH